MVAKEIWGNSCWYLFHTACHKLKPEGQHLVKPLLNIIIQISLNLPCPDCRAHASKTLAKTNFNTINTKEDIEDLIFRYHNYINKRLHKNQFTHKQYKELYNRAKLNNILRHWVNIMKIETHNQQDMLNSISKKNNINMVINFFNVNKNYFFYN